ncbi:MAG: glycine cleavage system protein H [Tissierellia bacterium]|nr:glycine cleavage system protein H [Tissierellia bacterium]
MKDKLLFTKNHEWIKLKDDKAFIGLTDFAGKNLGEVMYIDMPKVGAEFEFREYFLSYESLKAASQMRAPFKGKVLKVNDKIEDNPGLLNADAYDNWFIEAQVYEIEEDRFMDKEEYDEFIKHW